MRRKTVFLYPSPVLFIAILVGITLVLDWDPTGIFLIFGLIGLAFIIAFRFYWTERRVEFYDDFIRFFPKGAKKGTDIKYSEVAIDLKLGRGGFTKCIFTIRKESHEVDSAQMQKSWFVYNVKGKKSDQSLYAWLQKKTGISFV